ncbi:MAG: SH3 domain-containing protein [Pseudomonadota bacterium]
MPRFASLKAERARLRRGPGTSYPIDWELTRRGLPVRIIGEYGHWRRLELHDGTRGWMHKILLRGAPTALLLGDDRVLREEPHEAASAVARVDSATPVRVRDCRGAWCSVEVKDIEGWARRASLWGAGSRTE